MIPGQGCCRRSEGWGIRGAFTMFEGLYTMAVEHRHSLNQPGAMAMLDVAGESFKGMGFMKAQRGVGWLADMIKEETGVDPTPSGSCQPTTAEMMMHL